MNIRIYLFFTDILLLNVAFILSFLIRYGWAIPKYSFSPYKNSFVFLTLIYIFALSFFKVYKTRFRSSWELFKRIFLGLFFGTSLSIAFVYVFRVKWGVFPTSIFFLSFWINLLLIFKLNQYILKVKKSIKKKVIVIGKDDINGIVGKKADVERVKSKL